MIQVRKSLIYGMLARQKWNLKLNKAVIDTAEEIGRLDLKTARWIATEALRELRSDAVQLRLKGR